MTALLSQVVAKRIASDIVEDGWACVDSFLGHEQAADLAFECKHLEACGMLNAHCFEFQASNGERLDYKHEGRHFVDLDANRILAKIAEAAPRLAEFAAHSAPKLAQKLAAELPDLGLVVGADMANHVQVKLQHTNGSQGCAPYHFDTSETAPSRQLTLLIYLSEAWEPDFAGELQLQPFLRRPVTLRPCFDRAVFLG
eukprot:TRINITY_DN65116_c0_g1_i1.p1 TRINITY_DN65116_c0_g1~~TRINITY_DN65116_c0_g1_i1.p1  ORF type:complete len:198 (-),score=49.43 TRINITY_DN65116_c0_g1_i1:31-624(-)